MMDEIKRTLKRHRSAFEWTGTKLVRWFKDHDQEACSWLVVWGGVFGNCDWLDIKAITYEARKDLLGLLFLSTFNKKWKLIGFHFLYLNNLGKAKASRYFRVAKAPGFHRRFYCSFSITTSLRVWVARRWQRLGCHKRLVCLHIFLEPWSWCQVTRK